MHDPNVPFDYNEDGPMYPARWYEYAEMLILPLLLLATLIYFLA